LADLTSSQNKIILQFQLTCTLKGDWEGLYKRFFKSPNFVGWYNHRHKEVSQKLQVTLLTFTSGAHSGQVLEQLRKIRFEQTFHR
jgi:hypothetical protein